MLRQVGGGGHVIAQQVTREQRIGKVEQLRKPRALLRRAALQHFTGIRLKQQIELLHAAAATPQELPIVGFERGP